MNRITQGWSWWRLSLTAMCLALVLAASPSRAQQSPSAKPAWVGTWAASAEAIDKNTMPPMPPGLNDTTVRQIVRVSLGGKSLRVRFSNAFGPWSEEGLKITSAHIALSAGADAIQPATDRALTFDGQPSVAIPRGAVMYSDPVDFDLAPLAEVAVTIHVQDAAREITGHRGARCKTYLQPGDVVGAEKLTSPATATSWYYISGIDVLRDDHAAAVVVLGDSITDGRGITEGSNRRWTDHLAERLHGNTSTSNIAVLNQGIGGNAVWLGGLGQPALARFDRDVLPQAGAQWLIILEGVNDIGGGKTSVEQIIKSYKQLILRGHDRGLLVYGGTITPFGGSGYFKPETEQTRQAVNKWIRTSGAFDAVIDFDAAMRDPQDQSRLLKNADGGDHLHPGEEGYRLMADAIDLKLFTREDSK